MTAINVSVVLLVLGYFALWHDFSVASIVGLLLLYPFLLWQWRQDKRQAGALVYAVGQPQWGLLALTLLALVSGLWQVTEGLRGTGGRWDNLLRGLLLVLVGLEVPLRGPFRLELREGGLWYWRQLLPWAEIASYHWEKTLRGLILTVRRKKTSWFSSGVQKYRVPVAAMRTVDRQLRRRLGPATANRVLTRSLLGSDVHPLASRRSANRQS